jgi:hypothetical protein
MLYLPNPMCIPTAFARFSAPKKNDNVRLCILGETARPALHTIKIASRRLVLASSTSTRWGDR